MREKGRRNGAMEGKKAERNKKSSKIKRRETVDELAIGHAANQ
jgi:hypothetical protein